MPNPDPTAGAREQKCGAKETAGRGYCNREYAHPGGHMCRCPRDGRYTLVWSDQIVPPGPSDVDAMVDAARAGELVPAPETVLTPVETAELFDRLDDSLKRQPDAWGNYEDRPTTAAGVARAARSVRVAAPTTAAEPRESHCDTCQPIIAGKHVEGCPAAEPRPPQPAALTAERLTTAAVVTHVYLCSNYADAERWVSDYARQEVAAAGMLDAWLSDQDAKAAHQRVTDLERQLAEAQQRAAAGERVREAAQALVTAAEELHLSALPRCEACGEDIPETELWPVMVQACQRLRQALAADPPSPGADVGVEREELDRLRALNKTLDHEAHIAITDCEAMEAERDQLRRELEGARAEVESIKRDNASAAGPTSGPKRPEYEPKTIAQKLGYLIEECGEVLAAAGKTVRWGLDSYNPELNEEDRELNRDWLLRELSDLKAAIARVEPALLAPRDAAGGEDES